MTENEISAVVVDVCYKIHVKLGPGLLESVYEAILFYELTKRGLSVERQKVLPVIWDQINLDIGFRADINKSRVAKLIKKTLRLCFSARLF